MEYVLIENVVIVRGDSNDDGCKEAMLRTALPMVSMIFAVLTGWWTLQLMMEDVARIFVTTDPVLVWRSPTALPIFLRLYCKFTKILIRRRNFIDCMSKMTSTVSVADTPSASKGVSTPSKPPFRPSQNWTLLQKSLPQELSKKRKRSSKTPSSKPKSTTVQPNKKARTTYNPWRPSDSVSQKTGNPALILSSQTGDKVIKYVIK